MYDSKLLQKKISNQINVIVDFDIELDSMVVDV